MSNLFMLEEKKLRRIHVWKLIRQMHVRNITTFLMSVGIDFWNNLPNQVMIFLELLGQEWKVWFNQTWVIEVITGERHFRNDCLAARRVLRGRLWFPWPFYGVLHSKTAGKKVSLPDKERKSILEHWCINLAGKILN